MTTYVITIPGTFLEELTEDSRATLVARLRPADPQNTALGEAEELDILSVNENGTFNIRLEVEADNNHAAEAEAKRLAGAALHDAGLSEDRAPLGPAVITGIDGDF
ncbi:hypothetical protein [Streptomyces sp. NBC_00370]|uniref:hypothetical protein n=1 Tax=Streptomyces sp. NBC_00370 TaxID=2975728 RepID=UPI002E26B07C